jgi:hypothetical protein
MLAMAPDKHTGPVISPRKVMDMPTKITRLTRTSAPQTIPRSVAPRSLLSLLLHQRQSSRNVNDTRRGDGENDGCGRPWRQAEAMTSQENADRAATTATGVALGATSDAVVAVPSDSDVDGHVIKQIGVHPGGALRFSISLPLSFSDDAVVSASKGGIKASRTVGELVTANIDPDAIDCYRTKFAQMEPEAQGKRVTRWMEKLLDSLISEANSAAERATSAAERALVKFVTPYAKSAIIHKVLQFATTNTTGIDVQSIERIECVSRLLVVGTVDDFLKHCGVAPLSDAAASRERFAPVMDAWWRQLRSLVWKTKESGFYGYDKVLLAAATEQVSAPELVGAHPVAQSLIFSIFAALRSPAAGVGATAGAGATGAPAAPADPAAEAILADLWLFTERDLARGGWAPLRGVDGCDKGAAVNNIDVVDAENVAPLRRAAFDRAVQVLAADVDADDVDEDGDEDGHDDEHEGSEPATSVPAEPILLRAAVAGARWVGARQGFDKPENNIHRNTDGAPFCIATAARPARRSTTVRRRKALSRLSSSVT